MNQAIELTIEQEFILKRFANQVQQISHESARELLIDQQRVMMLRDTMFMKLLKHEWKLDLDSISS